VEIAQAYPKDNFACRMAALDNNRAGITLQPELMSYILGVSTIKTVLARGCDHGNLVRGHRCIDQQDMEDNPPKIIFYRMHKIVIILLY